MILYKENLAYQAPAVCSNLIRLLYTLESPNPAANTIQIAVLQCIGTSAYYLTTRHDTQSLEGPMQSS